MIQPEDRGSAGHGARMALSRREVIGAIAGAGTLAGARPAAAAQSRRGSGEGSPDFIVVGAGVFGAWIAWSLRRRGQRVLLVDAWGPGHARSSSGGETRLIRTEYAGNALYTRWAWESLTSWHELSRRHDSPVFHETGALYLYPGDNAAIDASIAMQRDLGIPIDKLDRAAMVRRWPQIRFEGVEVGVLQPTMGTLMARRSVQTLVADFVAAGGEYRQAAVLPPAGTGEALAALQAGRQRLEAGRFIFACGPWLPQLFPEVVRRRIVPTRQDVFFLAPAAGDGRFARDRMPAWVDVSSPDLHYGFPDIEGRGFKIALDRHGPAFDPDAGDRRVSDAAVADMRRYLARRFPDLASTPLAETRVCQYENSDNGHLLIDRHPEWGNVWIVGGGSGHGFKHGPAIGHHVASLALDEAAAIPELALSAHREHG